MSATTLVCPEVAPQNYAERNEKIVADFVGKKKNKAEIAREHGITNQRVAQIIKKKRPKKTQDGPPHISVEELIELFAEVSGNPMEHPSVCRGVSQ